jgi:hypothetical protein
MAIPLRSALQAIPLTEALQKVTTDLQCLSAFATDATGQASSATVDELNGTWHLPRGRYFLRIMRIPVGRLFIIAQLDSWNLRYMEAAGRAGRARMKGFCPMSFESPAELYNTYAATAANGSLVELFIRLLADISDDPQLQKYAYAGTLEDAELEIVRVYASSLSDGDADLLRQCRQLRNAVLHCNFPAVRKKLEADEPSPVVKTDATEMVAALVAAAEGDASKYEALIAAAPKVTDLSFKKGRLIGWLIHFIGSGEFAAAHEVFTKTIRLIERLRDSRQQIGKS